MESQDTPRDDYCQAKSSLIFRLTSPSGASTVGVFGLPSAMSFTPRTGSALTEDLATLTSCLTPVIPDFLYCGTTTMLASDPGVGKSIISMQLALALSSGTTLFGSFPIPAPQRVYYLQLEGSYYHSLERMRLMREVVPLSTENLCWDMGEGFNVLRPADWLALEQRIATFGHPQVIIIDPIYMLVVGGLSEDRPASAFVRFSNALMQTFGCANWLNHHTHRPHYANGEQMEEEDPFYGSQWLKAHVDASWLLTRIGNGLVRLSCRKDRHSTLRKQIDLFYHEESMTCEEIHFGSAPAMTRVLNFLNECKKQNVTTTFSEIRAKTGVSHAHLRRLQNEIRGMGIVNFITSSGRATCWVPK